MECELAVHAPCTVRDGIQVPWECCPVQKVGEDVRLVGLATPMAKSLNEAVRSGRPVEEARLA